MEFKRARNDEQIANRQEEIINLIKKRKNPLTNAKK